MLEAPQNQSTLQVNSNCDLTFGDHTALKTFLEQCPNISQAIRDELMRVYYEEYLILLEEKQPSLPLLVCTLIGFTIMILFGTIGSGLVIFVILRNPAMRTRSNLFIMNLAISDLTLCLITQPFTLYRLLIGHHPWTLGQFMCKFSAMFQGTNIFVSTISITAIALDRFKCIVYPKPRSHNDGRFTARFLCLAWLIAILLASPLTYFSNLVELDVTRCTEQTNNVVIQKWKMVYSIAALIIQYVLPLFIVSVVNSRICLKIRQRWLRDKKKPWIYISHLERKNPDIVCIQADENAYGSFMLQVDVAKEATPMQPTDKGSTLNITQTNIKLSTSALTDVVSQRKLSTCKRHGPVFLLLGISVIFGLSWLPLNIVNVWMDAQDLAITQKIMQQTRRTDPRNNSSTQIETEVWTNNSFFPGKSFFFLDTLNRGTSGRWIVVIQTVSLSMVLCSACANPILYGWLNTNFRKEFCRVLRLRTSNQTESTIKHPICAPDISTRVADKLKEDCGVLHPPTPFHSVQQLSSANQSKFGLYELTGEPVNAVNSTHLTLHCETELDNMHNSTNEKERFIKKTVNELNNTSTAGREDLAPTVVYRGNLETCDLNCSVSNESGLNFDETDVITQTEFLTEKKSTNWSFQGTSV